MEIKDINNSEKQNKVPMGYDPEQTSKRYDHKQITARYDHEQTTVRYDPEHTTVNTGTEPVTMRYDSGQGHDNKGFDTKR
jgi:hypothetical protein